MALTGAALLSLRHAPRPVVIFGACAAALVYLLHRGNLERLRQGEEGKVLEGETGQEDGED